MLDLCRIRPFLCNGVVALIYLPDFEWGYKSLMGKIDTSAAVITITSTKICAKHGNEYADVPCFRINFCAHCIAEARNQFFAGGRSE